MDPPWGPEWFFSWVEDSEVRTRWPSPACADLGSMRLGAAPLGPCPAGPPPRCLCSHVGRQVTGSPRLSPGTGPLPGWGWTEFPTLPASEVAPGAAVRPGGFRGALGLGWQMPRWPLLSRWTGSATCCRRSMASRTRTTRRRRYVLVASHRQGSWV